MCPFNVFFQGVACAVVQLELQALGFSTTFESMAVAVPQDKDEQWADIKRKYFFSDTCKATGISLAHLHARRTRASNTPQPKPRVALLSAALLDVYADYLPHCILNGGDVSEGRVDGQGAISS